MNKSPDITFILPVLNETYSLQQTVDAIFRLSGEHLKEILIVVADRTTPASMEIVQRNNSQHPDLIRIHKQKLPFLGGALREAISIASGNYIMLMASDFETDPEAIPDFIKKMSEGNWDIVAGSRWIQKGSFKGYSTTKLLLNYSFQKFFKILYGTALTDLTYAYRLYRKSVLQGIVWEELKHPFLLECLIKPLRCGAKVTEIPCKWKARTEGTSANTFLQTFVYFRTAWKTRFLSPQRIKPNNPV
ncbi:MAG: glycosyltransferase [Sedimentisphaerales bacterium]|jgi:glycosyltransferase involved in cell wall biosynthesis